MPYEMCRNSYGMPRGKKEFFFSKGFFFSYSYVSSLLASKKRRTCHMSQPRVGDSTEGVE